jgi:predicted negative regulator of RcsB-dependent stress response
MGGWRGWQYYQQKEAHTAATLYAEFTKQLDSGDAKRVNDVAAVVMDSHPASGYAPRAALLAAQVNEQTGDLARARAQLQWVLDHAEETGLINVARLRLASALLDEQKYDEALKLLEASHPASFDALYADLRGDVLSAQGKIEQARSSYQLAYEKTGGKGAYRALIELKMDGLGEVK